MIQPPDLQLKIAQWREKARLGTITIEEMQEAIILIRQGRVTAAASAGKAKSKRVSKSADDLLGELDAM